jgi:hypothetical protein
MRITDMEDAMEETPHEEGTSMITKNIKLKKMLDLSNAKLIDNKNLLVSVYRDKLSGEMYVCLQDSLKPETTMLITAEAVFHLADVVDRVFNASSTTTPQGTVH